MSARSAPLPDVAADASAPPACFHCGLPVPPGAAYPIRYENRVEPACCRGCQVVAQTIIDAGQGAYYTHRTALPGKPADLQTDLERLGLYDLPEIQQGFVKAEEGNVREAALILENIVCAACVWLNERHLKALPGVLAVDVNYATRRAWVRWDDSRIHLSSILKAVEDIGYRAHPYDARQADDLFRKERNTALRRLSVAALGAMQVMMIAYPSFGHHAGNISLAEAAVFNWASLILTVPVIFYSAQPFFLGAWRDLKRGMLGMDVPVALGIAAAFSASLWATLTGRVHEVYYDSVTMFVFMLLGGRFLELMARRKSTEAAQELVKLIPAVATRLPAWPDLQEEQVPVARLAAGDCVRVKPGETLPADGMLLEGSTSVDEAMLTGESRPVEKTPGQTLIGGTLNQDSPIVMRVDQVGENTRLAAIVRLLDRAQTDKPSIGRLADRAAAWFVGVLLVAALATGAIWYVVDPERALWVVVSMLVVTCPCALGLATPAALTTATGRLTQLGLLTTRGHALEALAKMTDLVFDKTGTLTRGTPRLLAALPASGGGAALIALASSLEAASEHPLGRTLRAAAPQAPAAADLQSSPGQGVEGRRDGRRYRLGKPGYVAELAGPLPPPPEHLHAGATWLALGGDTGFLGWLALGDSLREDAAAAVAVLKRLGIRIHVLSGDAAPAVEAVAQALGIEVLGAGVLPDGKLAALRALQDQGRVVGMVGDGVNDAPVLAQAQVSIALGEGTDVAQAAADMVTLGGRLAVVADGVRIARDTHAVIRQNLAWAVLYNLVAIPAAALGYVTPWIAAIGMSVSSILVVLNALRLTDFQSAFAEHGAANARPARV